MLSPWTADCVKKETALPQKEDPHVCKTMLGNATRHLNMDASDYDFSISFSMSCILNTFGDCLQQAHACRSKPCWDQVPGFFLR